MRELANRAEEIRARATSGLEKYISEDRGLAECYARYIWDSDRDTLWLLDENERLARENAALKLAIKDDKINFEFSLACETCACKSGCTYNRANGCVERHYDNWQFDTARFSGEGEG